MDGVFMSVRDQQRFRYIEDFRTGRLTRHEASLKLEVSERTVSRMARKVRGTGIKGIKHGNYSRVAHNRIPHSIVDFYVGLYRRKYAKFNFSHAFEQILTNESPPHRVGYAVFRKWCRAAGLGKIKRRRRSKAHYRRERAANEGFMVQLDGSPHKWNGEEEWTAITTIDDATSDIPSSKFFESETTWGCMEVMRQLIERKGIPEFVLTDCAGWSTGSLKRQNFSQFVRACQEIDIKVIGTPAPETKGRIERLNRTMQDRLVPELDLKGIKSMADANRYLDQVFLPDLRKRIGVEPVAPETRYRPIPVGVSLREVFCMKFSRAVNRDHTVQFENQRYLVRYKGVGSLWKHQVEIRRYQDEEIGIYYGGCRLEVSIVQKVKRRAWGN